MRTQASDVKRRIKTTIEECGKRKIADFDVTVDVHIEPPEPRTWDYPGSAASISIERLTVTSYSNADVSIVRGDRLDWFELLDRIAARKVSEEMVIDRLCDENLIRR